MSVRLLVCLSVSESSLSLPVSLLIAMAGGKVGAAQEQVAGRVMGSAHRHQRDLGQPVVATVRVSPELERQKERWSSVSYSKTS